MPSQSVSSNATCVQFGSDVMRPRANGSGAGLSTAIPGGASG